MAWELFLTGIPAAVLIAYMYFTHRDGTVKDPQSGQTYELQSSTGKYELLVAHDHGSGYHQEAQVIETGTCPQCGSNIGAAQHFCPDCGKKLQ